MSRRIVDATSAPVAIYNLFNLILKLVVSFALSLALLSHALGWSYVDVSLTVANWAIVVTALQAAIWVFLFFVMGIEIEMPGALRLPW